MLVHPSREVRYDCFKPKGNTCIQVVFTQSPVSLTTTQEYLPASGILDPLCICTRFHKQLHQSKERKSYLTCLRHCKTVQTNSGQKHENKQLTTKFPVSFQTTVQNSFHFLTQFRSFPMTHYMSQSNALTTAVQLNILGYLMHLTNQTNFPKQANTAHSVVNSQSQHQVPLCLQCHDGSYPSLSLSTLVPTLPGKQQCFRLQSQGHQSVQTSVKLHCSCTLLNLRCSIIHALHYTCGN